MHTLHGASAWIISDGKAGHEAQCLGVAAALALDITVKRIAPSGLFKLASPWGPVSPAEQFGTQHSDFAPPWPRIALATGRLTVPYMRALKQRAGLKTFTVILLDPRTRASVADLIWVPEHDRRRGANVISTLTSPHAFSPDRLAALRALMPATIAALPAPRVAVLVGGPNRDYSYNDHDVARFAAALERFAKHGAGLMITTSRRTPPALVAAASAVANGAPSLFYDGEGPNPYANFLAHADAFIVTADSVNMACEAAATGKPIYVFTPAGRSAKFDRFHAGLNNAGATRPLPDAWVKIEPWSYPPLDAAQTIADEILRRWSRRAHHLPGLVDPP